MDSYVFEAECFVYGDFCSLWQLLLLLWWHRLTGLEDQSRTHLKRRKFLVLKFPFRLDLSVRQGRLMIGRA
jgi:hypothetical protein